MYVRELNRIYDKYFAPDELGAGGGINVNGAPLRWLEHQHNVKQDQWKISRVSGGTKELMSPNEIWDHSEALRNQMIRAMCLKFVINPAIVAIFVVIATLTGIICFVMGGGLAGVIGYNRGKKSQERKKER